MTGRIAIVQRVLPHYRVPFFRGLRATLAQRDIELEVVYGGEYPGTVPRTVVLDEPWAHRIENRYIRLGHAEMVWQPCWHALLDRDLVVVEQMTRFLLNYALLARRAVRRRPQLAYWGHGRNFQATSPNRPAELVKRALATHVDWWFAYTQMSAAAVQNDGMPESRVTVVDNTIETTSLATSLAAVSTAERAALRDSLGIPDHAPVLLFCGGLHADKGIDFLLDACREIRTRVPACHVVFVGDGPELPKLEAVARSSRWMHPVGAVYGAARAAYFAISAALLMPAHVGLVIIDSFVTQTPMFTTDYRNHSPEIAYLQHGINGVMTRHDTVEYANAVVAYLGDPMKQARLRRGCADSAKLYTLDNMVSRFAAGVITCLAR